jgi:AraC-like DNA-binding protein
MKSESCSLSRVANYLAMTPRTLQRRLSADGTSFQAELDEVRNRVAIRYLEQTQMPLTNVSAMLGYADLAAFSRAFRRRNGVSPSGWRQKHQPRR